MHSSNRQDAMDKLSNVILGWNIGSWVNPLGKSGDDIDRFCKEDMLGWCCECESYGAERRECQVILVRQWF